jgi:hypothetical protein
MTELDYSKLDDEALESADIKSRKEEVNDRRMNVWRLRMQGMMHIDIAEELAVSPQTVLNDLVWILENLPPTYHSAIHFRRISMEQLERMFYQLEPVRDTPIGSRASVAIKDMQAKLLGAYAPTKVNADLSVNYSIEGVNTKELE